MASEHRGLTPRQYQVWEYLLAHPGSTQNDLRRAIWGWTGKGGASLCASSRVLNELQAKGRVRQSSVGLWYAVV